MKVSLLLQSSLLGLVNFLRDHSDALPLPSSPSPSKNKMHNFQWPPLA